MRIALVITELDPGGAEKCLAHLACFLQQQGHDVALYLLGELPPPGKQQLIDLVEAHGIAIRVGNATSSWQLPRLVIWLRRELRKFAPDVVQSFLFHANVTAALAIPKSARFFGGARVSQPETWRGRLQRWAARRMQFLVCVSQSVAEHCRMHEKIPSDKLTVIANGIAPIKQISAAQRAEFRAAANIPMDQKAVLFVGRLHEQKGLLPFISHAAPYLKSNPMVRLVVVGDGPQKTQLQEQIEHDALHGSVEIVGWTPDVMPWMQAADCLVLPARYEGMPNVVLEAMACGLPVVSFDVDGLRELLGCDAFADALLAPPGNYSALLDKLKSLLSERELQTKTAEHYLARARSEFDLQKQLLKYEELYHRKHN